MGALDVGGEFQVMIWVFKEEEFAIVGENCPKLRAGFRRSGSTK